ncbi:glycosyl transferase [Methylophilaceae bacterium]|nr:glycosyl transferase [Methylophilaceae bacterium]
MHKILIATDSFDQVNGVSTTYRNILKHSSKKTYVVHPGLFKWTNFSVYPEVQFCTEPLKAYKKIKEIAPTHIHIGTEGPIGLAARIYCKLNKIPYTTGYHTKFPEYLWKLLRIPQFLTYAYLKVFHNDSKAILVPSKSCQEELIKKGFNHVVVWTRGVAKNLISHKPFKKSKIPKIIYVGRVSKEKNLDPLCELENKFEITIVGEGPILNKLKDKYPKINFTGYRFGCDLADTYKEHDVFCFPSKTDTFGIVMIEALANGLPVAAYKVTGPVDIVEEGKTGYLGDNLEDNIRRCLKLNRKSIASNINQQWTWDRCIQILHNHLLN